MNIIKLNYGGYTMNPTIKTFFLGVAIFFTGACFSPSQLAIDSTNTSTSPPRTEREYEERRQRDTDRDSVIRNIRNRYSSGRVCEDLSGRDQNDCEDICKEIYSGDRGAKRECEELEVELIEDLKKVYEYLGDANDDDFASIDAELFDTYLNIGISGLEEVIEDYSSKDAEEFLYWLIEDEEISEIFRKEDDDYQALDNVFEQLNSNHDIFGDTPWKIFDEDINGDDLIELVINSSDEVIDWFMDYINERSRACDRDTKSRDCFKVYCNIGDIISPNDRDDWLDNESFEDYIEYIIDEGVNSTPSSNPNRGSGQGNLEGWTYGNGDGEFEELDDLDDNWVDELCGGLV